MKAKCQYCGEYWHVSTRQQIPKTGYKCPECASIRKNSINKANIGKTSKVGGKTNVQESLQILRC